MIGVPSCWEFSVSKYKGDKLTFVAVVPSPCDMAIELRLVFIKKEGDVHSSLS